MQKYNVVIVRGLFGNLFSRFKGLEENLKDIPKVDHIETFSWSQPNYLTARLGNFKDPTIVVAHSFGVGAFLNAAKALPKVEFPLFISVDPSQYWGQHILPANVKRCINFWQDAPLWFIGNQQISGAENILIDTSHVSIDDHPDVHKRIISEIEGAG